MSWLIYVIPAIICLDYTRVIYKMHDGHLEWFKIVILTIMSLIPILNAFGALHILVYEISEYNWNIYCAYKRWSIFRGFL